MTVAISKDSWCRGERTFRGRSVESMMRSSYRAEPFQLNRQYRNPCTCGAPDLPSPTLMLRLFLIVWTTAQFVILQVALADSPTTRPSLFDPTRHMRVEEVRPGMKGYGLTV